MSPTYLRYFVLVVMHLTLASATVQAKDVRIASHVSESSPLYANAQMFSERIGKEFPNEFNFKLYPNSQLAKEKALIDNINFPRTRPESDSCSTCFIVLH